MFIVVESIDGGGSSTQTNLLVEWFKEKHKRDCAGTYEPTNHQIGTLIRPALVNKWMSDKVLGLLFAADRLNHVEKLINPAIQQGRIVVCDRYVFSGMAYQSQFTPENWSYEINTYCRPADIAIFVDTLPKVAWERIRNRKRLDRYDQDVALQEKVRDKFLEYFTTEKGQELSKKRIIVNGNKDIDMTFSLITSAIQREVDIPEDPHQPLSLV